MRAAWWHADRCGCRTSRRSSAHRALRARATRGSIPAMRLTPHEQERLLISYAAELARRRQARGLRLNHPEAVAVITDHLLEGARDGRAVLGRDEVMDGVPDMLHDVQVEATFPDGTKLVTVHHPIA